MYLGWETIKTRRWHRHGYPRQTMERATKRNMETDSREGEESVWMAKLEGSRRRCQRQTKVEICASSYQYSVETYRTRRYKLIVPAVTLIVTK